MAERASLLAVYAHPDDETIHMGGTLARYAAAGARVVCVTANRGELGEIVDPRLAVPANAARLGEIRMEEMARALALLGASIESRWLGYRDSGTDCDPDRAGPDAFCRAAEAEVAGRVARQIREVRPHVVVTLSAAGAGEHHDHRHAALATRIAFDRAGDARAWPEQLTGPDAVQPWTAAKLYETHGHSRVSLSRGTKLRVVIQERGPVRALPVIAQAALRIVRPRREVVGDPPAADVDRPDPTTRISVASWMGARDAAIRAYRTQVAADDELLEHSPAELALMAPTENFTLLAGPSGTLPEDGLFAGLDVVLREPGPG